jgi:hypothetical protein
MTNESSGFFRDNGTMIDPAQVIRPALCETCSNDGSSEDEEILCVLTRSDQEGEGEFKCFSYKPKT